MHWIINGMKPAYYVPQAAVLKHVHPKISFLRSLCIGSVLYLAKNEEIYGIVPFQNFSMSFYVTFKKKTSTCGSGRMWVTSRLLHGSVGQVVYRCDPLSTLLTTYSYSYWSCYTQLTFNRCTIIRYHRNIRKWAGSLGAGIIRNWNTFTHKINRCVHQQTQAIVIQIE